MKELKVILNLLNAYLEYLEIQEETEEIKTQKEELKKQIIEIEEVKKSCDDEFKRNLNSLKETMINYLSQDE